MKKKEYSIGARIERGIILTEDNGSYIVASYDRDGIETPPLLPMTKGATFEVGQAVLFFMFGDGTGRIMQPLDGDLEIVNDITTDDIENGAVTAAKLANSAVTSTKLASNSVTASKISKNAVTEEKIKDLAVTEDKLANKSVTTSKMVAGSVTSSILGSLAVTAAKIANGAITAVKIATGAVVESKIADSAVTSQKIAEDAVTDRELANINPLLVTATGKMDDGTSYNEAVFMARNDAREARFLTSASGRCGIYDNTKGKWIIFAENNDFGSVHIPSFLPDAITVTIAANGPFNTITIQYYMMGCMVWGKIRGATTSSGTMSAWTWYKLDTNSIPSTYRPTKTVTSYLPAQTIGGIRADFLADGQLWLMAWGDLTASRAFGGDFCYYRDV